MTDPNVRADSGLDHVARDRFLAAVGQWATREPSVTVVLSETARLLTSALQADGCLVFRVQADGGLLLVASYPAPIEPHLELRLPEGFGVTGRVAADGLPVVLVDDDPRNALHRAVLGVAPGERVSRLCVPARVADEGCCAVIAVHSRSRREFTAAEVDLAQRAADIVGLRVFVSAASDAIRAYREEWDAVVASTVSAQEAERRRMAGDLHDGVTQAIASLRFHLSAADAALSEGDVRDAAEQVRSARTVADVAFDETRSAIAGLHSPVLDDLGLAAALVSMARAVPGLHIDVDAEDLALPESVSASLFRIAQESIQNVVKHAAASKAEIRLEQHGHMVVLTVADDGRGFEAPTHISGMPHAGATYGLTGMAERVHLIGGRLRILSEPGQGTTVEVKVPDVV